MKAHDLDENHAHPISIVTFHLFMLYYFVLYYTSNYYLIEETFTTLQNYAHK